MSNPVYRIEVEHDPHEKNAQWYVRVYELADEAFSKFTGYCASKEEAVVTASSWIREETRRKAGFVVYADEEGNAVEVAPHSVKS